jgi:hypothetical protein
MTENREIKKYIITTGDISDFDGFLAFPLYKQKAYDIGADVVFIMNYPAYMNNDEKPTQKQFYEAEDISSARRSPRPSAPSVYSAPSVSSAPSVYSAPSVSSKFSSENGSEDGSEVSLEDDYTSSFSNTEKTKFDEIAKKIILPTILSTQDYLFLDLYKRSDEGKGYSYNSHELFKIQPLNQGAQDYFKNIDSLDIKASSYRAKMSFLARHMCHLVWESYDIITTPGDKKPPPNLIFVEGGINEINPFSIRTIKNEFNVYCPVLKGLDISKIINKDKPYPYRNSITEFVGQDLYHNTEVYMDMNGSMAFYDFTKPLKNLFFNALKKVFIMGGVLADAQVSTMSTNVFLNRFASATMNQLYAKTKTGEFFNDINEYNNNNRHFYNDKVVHTFNKIKNKIKVYTVSNNEINKSFTYGPGLINNTSAKDNYKSKMQELCLIPRLPEQNSGPPDPDQLLVIKLFDAFYDAKKPAALNLHTIIFNRVHNSEAAKSKDNNTSYKFYNDFQKDDGNKIIDVLVGDKIIYAVDKIIDAVFIPTRNLVDIPYKPFDALSALTLVQNMYDNVNNSTVEVIYNNKTLTYIPEYGSTIIGSLESLDKDDRSTYFTKALGVKIPEYIKTDEFKSLDKAESVSVLLPITDITFISTKVIEDQIKNFFKPESRSGGYNYRSRSVKKTNKKPKKTNKKPKENPTPVKTQGNYTSKDGVSRQLYVMGEQLYVKMKDSKAGIFVYKKIKGAK